MNIKYLEHLYLPENYVVIDERYDLRLKLASNNFESLIDDIKRTGEPHLRSFICLSIYNLDADNKIVYGKSSILEAKDILSKHAYHRLVFLSNDLTEIYSEVFSLYSHQCDKVSFDGVGTDYCFDYGVLYGDYPLYSSDSIVKTNYLMNNQGKHGKPYDITNIKIYRRPECTITEEVSLELDIRCCYECLITDTEKVKDTYLELYEYDVDESCIPVATFI